MTPPGGTRGPNPEAHATALSPTSLSPGRNLNNSHAAAGLDGRRSLVIRVIREIRAHGEAKRGGTTDQGTILHLGIVTPRGGPPQVS